MASNNTFKTIAFALAAVLACWVAEPARAASDAEVNRIIKSLAPIRAQGTVPRYGKTRIEPDVDGERLMVAPDYTIEIEVFFEFDSAELTRRAERQLQALGDALGSEDLRPYRYLLIGHTDAVGDDDYNMRLSRQRARTVRDYLVETFPIEPHRLRAIGLGSHRLRAPRHPTAAINRRVEVVLIVPFDRSGEAPPVEAPAAKVAEPAAETPAKVAEPAANPAGAPTPGVQFDETGQGKIRW